MAKKKQKLHRMEIHPVENGYIVSHHTSEGGDGEYPSRVEQHVMAKPEDVVKHVEQTLGQTADEEADKDVGESPRFEMAEMSRQHARNVAKKRASEEND